MHGLQYISSRSNRVRTFRTHELTLDEANMPSTISTTTSMTREELFKLWKKRHEKYLQKVRETLEKIKLGINDSKMRKSKQYSILESKCYSITIIRKTNWTQNGLDQ